MQRFDWTLLLVPLSIVAVGMAAFYHAGPLSDGIIRKQLVFIFVGSAILITTAFFDYRIFKNYSAASLIFYLFSVILLALTLGVGQVRNVTSWLSFGGYTFEPSELAKLGVIVLLAKYFSQKHVQIYDIKHIIAAGLYVAVPTFLTFIQPDLGSAVVFIAILSVMLLSSGIKRRHLVTIIALGLIAASIGWFGVLKPYQKTRITTFLNPYVDPRGEGYSIIQARVTTGSGQVLGTLLTRRDVPVLVPEPYTDFAFAAFAQKFGFIGIGALFGALLLLIARVTRIVTQAHNNFAKLFGLGLLTMVLCHVFINTGMNIGLLPITGIPFSFLSYGGSHLMTLLLGFGLIESIRLHS